MISATHYLTLAAILFVIGTVGVITRRNVITMFMCVELMLNAVNLTFITFSHFFEPDRWPDLCFFRHDGGRGRGSCGSGADRRPFSPHRHS